MIDKSELLEFLRETHEQELKAEQEAVSNQMYDEAFCQQSKALEVEYIIWYIENNF